MPPVKIGLRFRFDVRDEGFEGHCRGFVPAATAQDTQKWERED